MKKTKIMALLLSATLVFSGCGNMNNTAKGGLIGGGGGAALGAIIGGIAGHGKGAAIGAAVGAAVGTGAGVLIGKKMDKAAEEAAQIQGAQVEQVTDNNGLQAVKVTFDSGILFNTGNAALSAQAKSALSKFANNVLNQNRDMDVSIYGYTDNQGWRNSTAEQSIQKNLNLSQERAQSVASYLLGCGVSNSQIKSVEGLGQADPIGNNDTAEGRQQNRRVEVYMYASQQMIQQAEAGTLKLILIHKHEKKDFKIHSQSAAFFLWFFHSRSYRFTLYSGLLYPVDVYPNYPTNHSWRRYKVEILLDT